jgi:hypothetical protein
MALGIKLNKLSQDLFIEFYERVTAWVFLPAVNSLSKMATFEAISLFCN